MGREKQLGRLILNALAANGIGNEIDIADYRNVCFIINISGAFSAGAVKIQGGIGDPQEAKATTRGNPDFSAAASVNNLWQYLKIINLTTGAEIDGSVGLPLTANGTYLIEANVNGITTMNLELSGITGVGAVTAVASAYGENR